MNNIEIVAYVKTFNSIPRSMPENHELYYKDKNSWIYLTTKGNKIYNDNKQDVDELINNVYQPQLDNIMQHEIKEMLI